MLGSSDYSAQVAGLLGLPFSFAHHFASNNTLAAVQAYRASFRPSETLDRPYVMLGVAVICAETPEQAQWLAGPSKLAFLRLRSGRPGRYPTPEEAAERDFTPMEQEVIRSWTASSVVGTPSDVKSALDSLVERTGADELMITTMVHGHADPRALVRPRRRDHGPHAARLIGHHRRTEPRSILPRSRRPEMCSR
jgi:luciferase family oxidoreductase group 1